MHFDIIPHIDGTVKIKVCGCIYDHIIRIEKVALEFNVIDHVDFAVCVKVSEAAQSDKQLGGLAFFQFKADS